MGCASEYANSDCASTSCNRIKNIPVSKIKNIYKIFFLTSFCKYLIFFISIKLAKFCCSNFAIVTCNQTIRISQLKLVGGKERSKRRGRMACGDSDLQFAIASRHRLVDSSFN